MLFNSLAFVIFFPVVTLVYFLLPHKYRWILLLAASCFFYMFFKPEYILILGFTIVVDYFAGISIEQATDKKQRKRYLAISIAANIGILAIFKYYNFFNQNVSGLALLFGIKQMLPVLKLALPIGLSFHTFQAMSYTIEVYRGNQKAERHFGIYSLYVMFYPQLVAGPIERPQNLIHQFREEHYFSYNDVVSGLKLMLWGMFKKVVIADRLAAITDFTFRNPHQHTATALFISAIFFSFQIYCDFSGYSDIAIGSARVMGFKLRSNFNRPYSARSIADFWRRWHISLSTWFKDYLYIPLGGNKVGKGRMYLNIIIVFLVSGLWHGANWTFVVWGGLFGFYYVFGIVARKIRARSPLFTNIGKITWLDSVLQISATFTLVTIAWIFFRATNVSDALFILRKFLSLPGEWMQLRHGTIVTDMHTSLFKLAQCILAIIILESVQWVHAHKNINVLLANKPRYVRWGVYYMVVLTIIYMGIFPEQGVYLFSILSMKGFIVRLICFILIPMPLLYGLSYIIDTGLKKSNYIYYAEWNDLFAGKINADLLICGSSRAWKGISPAILDTALHLNSYNIGMDGTRFSLQYDRLKIYLLYNKAPKYVVQTFDYTSFAEDNSMYHPLQFLPYLSNPAVREYTAKYDDHFGFADYYFPLFKYNNQSTIAIEGIKSYFGKGVAPIKYKGFQGQDKPWDYTFENYKRRVLHPVKVHVSNASVKRLHEYLEMCNQKGIKVIMVFPPVYHDFLACCSNEAAIVNIFKECEKQYGDVFLDYSKDEMTYGKTYFYNSQHLNKAGADMFSVKLARDLKGVMK